MSTTTICLSKELKDRVARATERAGKTPHGFIPEAIAEKTELEERRAAFVETAEQRYAGVVASGKTVAWSEMRQYLERRIPEAELLLNHAVSRDKRGSNRARSALDGQLHRIVDHLLTREVEHATTRVRDVISAIDVLEQNPLIGRAGFGGEASRERSDGSSGRLVLAAPHTSGDGRAREGKCPTA